MPRETTADKLKISLSVGAGIVVIVVSVMVWFFDKVPQKKDIDDADVRSSKIVAWVKEEIVKIDSRALASEGRFQSQIDRDHQEYLSHFTTIETDIKKILAEMPRRSVDNSRHGY